MPTRARQSGPVNPYPRWMQVLAAFCIALVLGATSVQASHLHGNWSLGHAPQLTGTNPSGPAGADDEADCPLCMVLHAALAPSLVAAVQPVAPLTAVRTEQVRFAPALVCHFPALSRPPPTQA